MDITPKKVLIVGIILEAMGVIAFFIAASAAIGYPSAESDPRSWIPIGWYIKITLAMLGVAVLTVILMIITAIIGYKFPDQPSTKVSPSSDNT